MTESHFHKIAYALIKLVTRPRESLAWVCRGNLLTDKVLISYSYWNSGTLPRKSLKDILPETKHTEITLPRAFDRTFRTSITVEEACTLAVIACACTAKKILEIGTFDGNTTLVLASNISDTSTVVTVDLPPDFDLSKDSEKLEYKDTKINLTPREHVARQYQEHRASSRITQIYGDSASLDWNTFGGPFDFIFIDGCHKEAYVRTDSENALKVLGENGIIVWHDYSEILDVSRVVDDIARTHPELTVCALEGTRLAFGQKIER